MSCYHLMVQRGRLASIQGVSSMAQMFMMVTESGLPQRGQSRCVRHPPLQSDT
jgi:hypothetical protein